MDVHVYAYMMPEVHGVRRNKMWVYGKVGKKEIERENYSVNTQNIK